MSTAEIASLIERAITAETECERLKALINTPEVFDFVKAVQLEAAHQRKRWGSDHDAGKSDADWFWLIGYLAGKALHNPGVDAEKQLHRIITIAAAAANWHAAKRGQTNMRPGIETPAGDQTMTPDTWNHLPDDAKAHIDARDRECERLRRELKSSLEREAMLVREINSPEMEDAKRLLDLAQELAAAERIATEQRDRAKAAERSLEAERNAHAITKRQSERAIDAQRSRADALATTYRDFEERAKAAYAELERKIEEQRAANAKAEGVGADKRQRLIERIVFGGMVSGGDMPNLDEQPGNWMDAQAFAIRIREATGKELSALRTSHDALTAECERAWQALGTTEEDAADDPDTAALSDSIRVSLQYERDRAAQTNEELDAALARLKSAEERERESRAAVIARLVEKRDQYVELGDHDGANAARDCLVGTRALFAIAPAAPVKREETTALCRHGYPIERNCLVCAQEAEPKEHHAPPESFSGSATAVSTAQAFSVRHFPAAPAMQGEPPPMTDPLTVNDAIDLLKLSKPVADQLKSIAAEFVVARQQLEASLAKCAQERDTALEAAAKRGEELAAERRASESFSTRAKDYFRERNEQRNRAERAEQEL